MKNLRKKIIAACILLMTILLAGCLNEGNENIGGNVPLLPKQIVQQAVLDAEPNYLYTYRKSFEYDDLNRPTTITDVTSRTYGTTQAIEVVYSNTITLEYPKTGATVKRTEKKKLITTSGQNEITETRDYYALSGNNSKTIKIIVNGQEENTETIELNEKKQVVRYLRNESAIQPSIAVKEEYSYDNWGNVSQHDNYSGEYHSARRYTYDNYNGIFRYLNIPQWLAVTMFDIEHIANNAKRISVKTTGDTFSEYGWNQYRYNGYGYPIEQVFESDWLGIWSSKTRIEYMLAKPLTAE